MELNDSKIKRLVASYKNNKDLKVIDELRKEVDIYIYNFPKLAYRQTYDFCGEFYLYVIERLEAIIKNYPLEEEIKFKTWFNYVLRNQYINFCMYQKKCNNYEVSIDNYSEILPIESMDISEEQINDSLLHKGITNLDNLNRIFIKFYYFPEYLDFNDILFASKYFQLSIKDILNIQSNLIRAIQNEIEKIRVISQKLNIINKKLVDLRYELYNLKNLYDVYNDEFFDKNNEYLKKIARLENSRNKLLRYYEIPERNTFLEFSRLFRNSIIAKVKIKEAKRRLKFEILKLINEINGKIGD